MKSHKRFFVAATQQNDGKSTICLGLIHAFRKKYPKLGFIKPIGHHFIELEGYKIDEDVVLMHEVYNLNHNLHDMNPIPVGKGFTERFIKEGGVENYAKVIKDAYNRVSSDKDLMIIEGTGHAGVGAVLNLSNATVAKILNSKVIIVTTGGIGRTIDEIMINKALFDKESVEIIGVIINKVRKNKFDKIKTVVGLGLEQKGIKLLGAIPFQEILSYPTMKQIMDATESTILWGEEFLGRRVKNVLVGAMEPYHALNYFTSNSLVIVPGDREDIILAVIATEMIQRNSKTVSGMILTGGLLPHKGVMDLIRNCRSTILFSEDDTYQITKRVHECRVKIKATDKDKIDEAVKLVEDYVDMDEIVARL